MKLRFWLRVITAVTCLFAMAMLLILDNSQAEAQSVGTYRGNINGDINGVLELTVRGPKVSGIFSGRLANGNSGTVKGTVSGTYTTSGDKLSLTLTGTSVKKVGAKSFTVKLSGTMTGAVKGNVASGSWKITVKSTKPYTTKGTFKANKVVPPRPQPARPPGG